MDVNSKFNYYDVLELNPQCPQHEISTAYERLKLTYSGDNPAVYTVFTHNEAREMLALIEMAYSVLGNKNLRLSYDERLNSNAQRPSEETAKNETTKVSPNHRPSFKSDDVIESEIKSCLDWSGEMLKKVREYKGWQVDKIAELTKISSYYIKAIEKVEPRGLPAPVFVRGYVSQLCRIYGLDEKKVCDTYMKHFKKALEAK